MFDKSGALTPKFSSTPMDLDIDLTFCYISADYDESMYSTSHIKGFQMGGFSSGKKHFAIQRYEILGRKGKRALTPPERVRKAQKALTKARTEFLDWIKSCRSAAISCHKHSYVAEKHRREEFITSLEIRLAMEIDDLHRDRQQRADDDRPVRRRKGLLEGLGYSNEGPDRE